MKKFTAILMCLLLLGLACTACTKKEPEPEPDDKILGEGKMNIEYLSVGNGDCTLLLYGDKASIIDTGYTDAGDKIVERLKSLGVTEVEYLILTHMHSDRIGGAPAILNGITVKNVVGTNTPINTDTYEDLMKTLGEHGLDIEWPSMTKEYTLSGGGKIQFLHPGENDAYDDFNQYSTVFLVYHGDLRFMFCGDADTSVLNKLAQTEEDISASIVLLSHHGSKSAMSSDFFDKVKPTYALVSYGYTPFAHNSKEVLSMLRGKGIKIGDMFENGSYELKSDGTRLEIKPFSFRIESTNDRLSSVEVIDRQVNVRAEKVYVATANYKYHTSTCKSISSQVFISLEQASEEFEPCEICNPPVLASNGRMYMGRGVEIGRSEILGIVGDTTYGSPGVSQDVTDMTDTLETETESATGE